MLTRCISWVIGSTSRTPVEPQGQIKKFQNYIYIYIYIYVNLCKFEKS